MNGNLKPDVYNTQYMEKAQCTQYFYIFFMFKKDFLLNLLEK